MTATKLGPLMIDLAGPTITAQERELLKSPLVCGVILFSRQFENKAQIRHLIAELRAIRDPRLLIAVDHEGGRVQRFRSEFTVIPPMRSLGELHNKNPEYALHLAYACGFIIAVELIEIGIDLNFGPVLDLDNPESGVIGDRSFNADPNITALLAKQVIRGMNEAGMRAIGKHFPGHGGVKEDSHLERPIDHRTLDDLKANDLKVFAELFEFGLPGIMTAHIMYDQIDPLLVTYSQHWLKEILRDQMKFKGVVFSDALDMLAAAQGSYVARVKNALQAGCDITLLCNISQELPQVADKLKNENFPDTLAKIQVLYARPKPREVTKAEALREEIARFYNEKQPVSSGEYARKG